MLKASLLKAKQYLMHFNRALIFRSIIDLLGSLSSESPGTDLLYRCCFAPRLKCYIATITGRDITVG